MAAIALALLVPNPARADFNDGLRSYDAGDYRASYRAWRPLAERGHVDAQIALGGLYMAGFGVRRNSAEGARWYERAARQGSVIAQLNIGDFYARGIGVKRDLATAYFWLSLAAAKDNDWAIGRRKQVMRSMSRQQLAEGKRLLKAWRQRNPPAK